MIATIINAAAVLAGALFGLVFHGRVNDRFKQVVFTGVGFVTLIIGMSMALESTRILYLALSLVSGGVLGNVLDVEGGIYRFGEGLKRRFASKDSGRDYALGFLNASVLFCVGAMTLVGSFKAGTEGDYTLILTKSVMDGFMAILLTSAQGIGVAFSAIPILVYQGGLTLLSGLLKPHVTPLMLSELSAVGGAMVLMIGFNLLSLREIKTGNYLPALLVVLLLVILEGFFPFLALP